MSEITKCFLCNSSNSQRSVFQGKEKDFNDDCGWKYICSGNCPDYAFGGPAYSYIETFHKSREDKQRIIEYLNTKPLDEGKYIEITQEELKRLFPK